MSIEITGLRKSFGGAAAVDEIDLSIKQGEMLVLLGPSGCGKTTTMRCIAGLQVPDAGRIAIGGRTVFDDAKGINIPVNKRHVGMVFQSYAIWPHMTVYENVAFPLEMEKLRREEINDRVRDILVLVGLDGFGERSASYLSGGQMQRVALARSLVMQPSVLLFDEPLSNLDARLRDRLRVQLRELQTKLSITSVYVTHDQQEALALADQIAVMNKGRILQIGDPITIYTRPASSIIADFLGYSNMFAGEILQSDGDSHLVAIPGSKHRFRAVAGPNREPKKQFSIGVRPDTIEISLLPEQTDGPLALPDNSVTGKVQLASFMGTHMHYRVKADEGETWEIFSTRITPDIRLGSSVLLRISPANVHLLATE